MKLGPEMTRRVLELAAESTTRGGSVAVGDRSSTGPTEKAFQAEVVKLARRHGWKCYHAFDSRKSAAGFPDLVLVRDRVLFVELKTATGTTSPDQDIWLEALRAAGAEVHVWRPADWPAIARNLE